MTVGLQTKIGSCPFRMRVALSIAMSGRASRDSCVCPTRVIIQFIARSFFARSGHPIPLWRRPLTEISEEAASADLVEDIALLARRLAEKEPFKSASGPEALLALATHLDGMVAGTRPGQRPVNVAVRARSKKGDR
jgi:hypothetical protein